MGEAALIVWSDTPGAHHPARCFHAACLPPTTMIPALAEFQTAVRERGLSPTGKAFHEWAVVDGGEANSWGWHEYGPHPPPGTDPAQYRYRITGLENGTAGGVFLSADTRDHATGGWQTTLWIPAPAALFGHAARLLRRQAVRIRRDLAQGCAPARCQADPQALTRRAERYEAHAAADQPLTTAHPMDAMRWTPPTHMRELQRSHP